MTSFKNEDGNFHRMLDEAVRRTAERLSPLDIARIAVETKAPLGEAFAQMRIQGFHHWFGGAKNLEALNTFVEAVCRKSEANEILEFSGIPNFLTGNVADSYPPNSVTYISRDVLLCEALELLLKETKHSVYPYNWNAEVEGAFDAVVYQPTVGSSVPGTQFKDSFGGDFLPNLVSCVRPQGRLYWITAQGIFWNKQGRQTLLQLSDLGLHIYAVIDLAPSVFFGSSVKGVIIVLGKQSSHRRFVGALREGDDPKKLVDRLFGKRTKGGGANWEWLDADDTRSFAALEHERYIQKMWPKGNVEEVPLRLCLQDDRITKADKPVPVEQKGNAFLFVPEYTQSRVTADIREQTVNPRAIFRLPIDTQNANPHFLARMLNSPIGKVLRQAVSSGVVIPRTRPKVLCATRFPIPDIDTQNRIASIDSEIRILKTELTDREELLDADWTKIADLEDVIARLKAVLDIDRQIGDWWQTLPYPLATVYRLYTASQDLEEKFRTLLHFFEVAGTFLATMSISFVNAARADSHLVMREWLFPDGRTGIKRPDFGFWIILARTGFKDLRRFDSDPKLKAKLLETSDMAVLNAASSISKFGRAIDAIDVARQYRNDWVGHGGRMRTADYSRLHDTLEKQLRDFYASASPLFKRVHLVRPLAIDLREKVHMCRMEMISGTDGVFEQIATEWDGAHVPRRLAFWVPEAQAICPALPFFRFGAPEQPDDKSIYVFNRKQGDRYRWVSFHDAREQEIFAEDDELSALMELEH